MLSGTRNHLFNFTNNGEIIVSSRTIGNKLPLKTSEAHLVPCKDGYIIEPLSDKVMINGKRILEKNRTGHR